MHVAPFGGPLYTCTCLRHFFSRYNSQLDLLCTYYSTFRHFRCAWFPYQQCTYVLTKQAELFLFMNILQQITVCFWHHILYYNYDFQNTASLMQLMKSWQVGKFLVRTSAADLQAWHCWADTISSIGGGGGATRMLAIRWYWNVHRTMWSQYQWHFMCHLNSLVSRLGCFAHTCWSAVECLDNKS